MVDIGNGGFRDFHEAVGSHFQTDVVEMQRFRESRHFQISKAIFADIRGGRTSGHHDQPVTPSSEVFGAVSV
jgi:hypothetical protein